jgi:hypothetical protein
LQKVVSACLPSFAIYEFPPKLKNVLWILLWQDENQTGFCMA